MLLLLLLISDACAGDLGRPEVAFVSPMYFADGRRGCCRELQVNIAVGHESNDRIQTVGSKRRSSWECFEKLQELYTES